MIDLLEAALKQPGWIDDKVVDQFPRADGNNASGIALSDPDDVDNHNNGEKHGFSESLGMDIDQLPVNQPKGN